MEPVFLTLEEVLELHNEQVLLFGGEPSVRDMGLLQSAIAMPQAMFGGQYLHEFPHEMAASYLFHIVANHPFVDGNKRTGLSAALMFLEQHGLHLNAEKPDVAEMVLSVAAGGLDKTGVNAFFKKHTRA